MNPYYISDLYFNMSKEHGENCGCSTHAHSTSQTLSELEFERGLWTAAIDNDVGKVEKLLRQGNNPNKRDNAGYTALHYAARAGSFKVLMALLNHGADPNSQTPSGKTTPLHRAAYMGHLECLQILIQHGAHVNLVDSDGKSALHKCAEREQYTCAEWILDTIGANFEVIINAKDRKGNTPFDLCSPNQQNAECWKKLFMNR